MIRLTGWEAVMKKVREDFWLVRPMIDRLSASGCSPLPEEFFYVHNACDSQVRTIR